MRISFSKAKRRTLHFLSAIGLLIFSFQAFSSESPIPEMDPSGFPAPTRGCLTAGMCHGGIEPITAHNSKMAKEIYKSGRKLGDPNGCVVCHGGNPEEENDAKIAHTGTPRGSLLEAFNRHSASMGINEKTCGQCHKEWVYAGHRSVM